MAEATMFESEGACFYWASVERPDFLVFGFNMSHIAMIISEALEIPTVGFFLQPTRKVENRKHALSFIDEVLMPFREKVNGTTFNAVLMQVFDQVNTTGESTAADFLRKTRGLIPTPLRLADEDLHFKELLRQNVPIVVPINSLMVEGSRPGGNDIHGLHLSEADQRQYQRGRERFYRQGKRRRPAGGRDDLLQHAHRPSADAGRGLRGLRECRRPLGRRAAARAGAGPHRHGRWAGRTTWLRPPLRSRPRRSRSCGGRAGSCCSFAASRSARSSRGSTSPSCTAASGSPRR
ncbi:unnamed protein product, partial [Prorocentrum cordatum]